MKKLILFLNLCFLLSISACNNLSAEAKSKDEQEASISEKKSKPADGTVVHKNEGRNTTSEITYKDGLKHGISREYYSNGKVWKETSYENGKLNGVAKVYERNGKMKRSVTYKNGKKHGSYTRYFKSGNPKIEIEYNEELPLSGYIDRDYTGKIKDEPRVVVTHKDQMATDEIYILEVGLSEAHENTIVYAFEDPDLYHPSTELFNYRLPIKGDKAFLPIEVPRGYFFANQIHFFVQYDLLKGVRVVKQETVNLAVENNF